MAIEKRNKQYLTPNRTFLSYHQGVSKKGSNLCEVLGFWGDIIQGPYFGLSFVLNELDKDSFTKTVNGKYKYHSGELAEYNMINFISTLDDSTQCPLKDLGTEVGQTEEFQELGKLKALNFKIIPLFQEINKFSELKKIKFDVVYTSFIKSPMFQSKEINIFKKNGLLLVEDPAYMVFIN